MGKTMTITIVQLYLIKSLRGLRGGGWGRATAGAKWVGDTPSVAAVNVTAQPEERSSEGHRRHSTVILLASQGGWRRWSRRLSDLIDAVLREETGQVASKSSWRAPKSFLDDCELWFDITQNDKDGDGLTWWQECGPDNPEAYGTDPTTFTSGDIIVSKWYNPDTASHEVLVSSMRFENDIDMYCLAMHKDINLNWVTKISPSPGECLEQQAGAYVRGSHITTSADITSTQVSAGCTVNIEVQGVLNGKFIQFYPITKSAYIGSWSNPDYSTYRFSSIDRLPDEIGVHQLKLYWKITTNAASGTFVSEQETVNTIYTTWDEPMTGPHPYYMPERDLRTYVEVIGFSCEWATGAKGKDNIMRAVMEGLWNEAPNVENWRFIRDDDMSTDSLILQGSSGVCGEWAEFFHSLVECQGLDVTLVVQVLRYYDGSSIETGDDDPDENSPSGDEYGDEILSIGGKVIDRYEFKYAHAIILGGPKQSWAEDGNQIFLADIQNLIYDVTVDPNLEGHGFIGSAVEYFNAIEYPRGYGEGTYMYFNGNVYG